MNPNLLVNSLLAKPPAGWVVFVGAGISINSGIPSAKQLTGEILGALSASTLERRLIGRLGIPFELVMETLQERIDISPVLEVFQSTTPNAYHFFLARMLAQQQIETIVTTNFDTLIEQALEITGLRQGRDFQVHSHEKEFNAIVWANRKPRIIKLHGCITDKDNILVTLSRVANRTFLNSIRPTIRQLFSDRTFRQLLILGYSCSDYFDISPNIQALGRRLTRIVFVQHIAGSKSTWHCEPLSDQSSNNPFKTSKDGYRLWANTQVLVKQLWGNNVSLGPYHQPIGLPTNTSWKRIVKQWGRKTGSSHSKSLGSHIIGRLLIKGNMFVPAREALMRSLYCAQTNADSFMIAQARLNLGICAYRLGNASEALSFYRLSLSASRRLKLRHLEGQILGNIGNVHYSANRLSLSAKFQKRCLKMARSLQKKQLVANTLGNLGIVWEKRHNYILAQRYHIQARRLAVRIGDVIGEARHMYNLALSYRNHGRLSLALKWFAKAEDKARLAAQDEITGNCLLGKGKLFQSVGQSTQAETALREALDLFEHTNSVLNRKECYEVLVQTYKDMGRWKKAQQVLKKASRVIMVKSKVKIIKGSKGGSPHS